MVIGAQELPRPPPKMEAKLDFNKRFLEGPSWLPFWRGLGGQEAPIDIFLSAQDEWEEPKARHDGVEFMGPPK